MTSLLIHAGLGLLTVVLFFRFNSHLYKAGWPGAGVTVSEAVYYLIAVGSVCAGWYFNVKYVSAYPQEAGWIHFTKLGFANPAAGSISQDEIIPNVLLFPLWTMIDGPRRGLKRTWLYFVMTLFTSFGCGIALYLAAQERQLRWNKAMGK
ncbi:MAG: DUF2834 domain-containing protein [Nevskia sp.]|nr:DUF2834 domain-containing protein [Nevskia sp.]